MQERIPAGKYQSALVFDAQLAKGREAYHRERELSADGRDMTDQPWEERLVALGRRKRHVVVDLANAFITEELGREDVGRRKVLLL